MTTNYTPYVSPESAATWRRDLGDLEVWLAHHRWQLDDLRAALPDLEAREAAALVDDAPFDDAETRAVHAWGSEP